MTAPAISTRQAFDDVRWATRLIKRVADIIQTIAVIGSGLANQQPDPALGRKLEEQVYELWRRAQLMSVQPTNGTGNLVIPAPWVRSYWVLPLCRLMAAVDTLAKLTAAYASARGVPVRMRQLKTADLPVLNGTLIPYNSVKRMEERVRSRLFTEQALDLVGVLSVWGRLGMPRFLSLHAQVETALGGASQILGSGDLGQKDDPVLALDQNCLDASQTADLLFGRDTEQNRDRLKWLADHLALIAVLDYDGSSLRFPRFQFAPRIGLKPEIAHVLDLLRKRSGPADPHPLDGWPLAIWVYANTESAPLSPGLIGQILSEVGLSRDASTPAEADQLSFRAIQDGPQIGKMMGWPRRMGWLLRLLKRRRLRRRNYYRVGSNEKKEYIDHPYRYSRHDDPAPNGRYDPANSLEQGTLYLAEDALGCWAEVLDRQLVVTLSYLATRALHVIEVGPDAKGQTPKLLDLTDQHSRLNAASRNESQAVAQVAASNHFDGILYSLRTLPTHLGLAVFGLRGPREIITGPAAEPSHPLRGVKGIWTKLETINWYDSKDLWRYLEMARSGRSPAFPVILRRLPDLPV